MFKFSFLVYGIDLFNLEGKFGDMYPYLLVKITNSNVEKSKIMATVPSIPTDPFSGHHHS